MSSSRDSANSHPPRKSFRDAPVTQRSIWESWAVLPAKTRLRVSLGLTGFALAGIWISDQLEKVVPPSPTAQGHAAAENTTNS